MITLPFQLEHVGNLLEATVTAPCKLEVLGLVATSGMAGALPDALAEGRYLPALWAGSLEASRRVYIESVITMPPYRVVVARRVVALGAVGPYGRHAFGDGGRWLLSELAPTPWPWPAGVATVVQRGGVIAVAAAVVGEPVDCAWLCRDLTAE